MEKLSIEEKAKRYDKVFEKAKKNYVDAQKLREGYQLDVECFKEILESLFPELVESEDERIRKMLIEFFGKGAENNGSTNGISDKDILAWLERQGKKPIGIRSGHATGKLGEIIKDIESEDKIEALRTEYAKGRADAIAEMQKSTQETEPFKAEHGKYYYCIKDYFYGGKKQASKGDVIQALRGLPIMGLKDASEYFLPVNSIKCNSAWNEEDESILQGIRDEILANKHDAKEYEWKTYDKFLNWLKSLKQRIGG